MNCIILEDEIPAQKIIKNYLSKLPNTQLLGTFNTAIEANSFLKSNKIDLIFLDINLPDISGLDFIKTIKTPPALIITTAYPDFAARSFELDTIVDYLVKPFGFDRFLKAINKVETRINNKPVTASKTNSESLFINVDKTLHKIIIEDILFLESNRNYITLVTKSKKFSFIDSLKNWNIKLTEDYFIQVHKSFIINRNHVNKISGNEIYIQNQRIPIGRNFKQVLLKTLNIS